MGFFMYTGFAVTHKFHLSKENIHCLSLSIRVVSDIMEHLRENIYYNYILHINALYIKYITHLYSPVDFLLSELLRGSLQKLRYSMSDCAIVDRKCIFNLWGMSLCISPYILSFFAVR